ncbi:MAG: DUF3466 family protein [Acidobacteria bacterium]|nr:DUF3466 family protein [Acidobacteriota bacterium]
MTSRWITRALLACMALVPLLPAAAHAATLYRVTDLGFLPAATGEVTNTLAEAINDTGQITGMATAGANGYAFLWDAGGGLRAVDALPLRAAPFYFERGLGINAAGQIAGNSTADGSTFLWDPVQGVRRVDGGPFPPGGIFNPDALVSANDINATGTIVGRSWSVAPVMWNAATGAQSVLPRGAVGAATAINDAGQIVGYTNAMVHGFLWQDGVGAIAIAGLAGTSSAVPADVNMAGVVVGEAAMGTASLAFIWDAANGTRYLGDLQNAGAGSRALAINDLGFVVGSSASISGSASGFVWHASTGMVDLNLAIDPSDPLFGRFRVFTALDINAAGQIVGQGLVDGDGRQHSFLLTPVPEPQTWAMVLAGLALTGVFARRRAAGDRPATAHAHPAAGASRGLLHFLPPRDHRLDVGERRMPGGGEIDVGDEEDQHHEGTDGVQQRDRAERGRAGRVAPARVIEQRETAHPDERVDDQLDEQVGEALQRVVLSQLRGAERMGRTGENAQHVIAGHGVDVRERRDVLAPFAGGEVPEDREHPQRDERPGGSGVQSDRPIEAEQVPTAVDLEAGDQHGDDQRRLGPMPEALEALEDVDALAAHRSSPLRLPRVTMRRAP